MLVGGASRRMGRPKAWVELDGEPLASRVGRALRDGGATEVAAIGTDPPGAARLGLTPVDDDRPGEGPLAALATALTWARATASADLVVVAACDQPDLTRDLVAALVAAAVEGPEPTVGVVPQGSDGRRQPFPGAWRTSASALVEQLVRDGERRMAAALDLGVTTVPTAAEVLLDLDTPGELAVRRGRTGRPAP